MGKVKTIRQKESTKKDPNPYQTYPIMTSQILLSTAIIVIMFLLFYIRTKRLLNKNLDILKKDNDSTFFYIKKIESRLAKPIEDFNTNGELQDWAIIVCYNRTDLLKITIETLKEKEPNLKILAVDNGGKPEVVNILNEFKQRKMIDKILLNTDSDVPQWQKSFAISQAIKLLTLETVNTITIVDDDVIVTEPWIKDSLELMKQFPEVKIMNYVYDGEQVHNHKPEREITFNNKQVKILNSFCGCFFMLTPETIRAIGYPPIAEGTNDAAYEDWFYTRQIQVRNWKAAALIKGTNQGYDKSIREEKEKLNNNI